LVARRGPLRRPRPTRVGQRARSAPYGHLRLAAAANARRRLWHRFPDETPAWRGGRPRCERTHARAGTSAGAERDVRAGRGTVAALRGRRIPARLHELLLLPSGRRGPRALPHRSTARRVRARRRRVHSACGRPARALGRQAAEGRLALDGLQAGVRRRRPRARARRTGRLQGALVRRRSRLTRRRSSYRSFASLQRDLRACRACIEAGFHLESLPVLNDYVGQRAYMYGQAPGVVEGEERRPWRGRAGKTLRRWL